MGTVGLPIWLSGKESACHCRGHRRCWFDSWVGKIPRRRERQPTPVFLPGESHGQRSSAGYSPWGCKRTGHAWAHVHAGMCPYCTPFSCVFLSRALPRTQHVVRALVVFTFSFLIAFLVLLNIVPKNWRIPRVSPNCCLKLTNDSQVHGGIRSSCLLNITNGMLRGPSNSSHPEAQGPHSYFVQSKEGGRFPWAQKL